jgi:hypothetical protein
MGEPAHVGCLVEVRVIGVIEADQTEDGSSHANARLLASRAIPVRTKRSRPSTI